MKNESEAIYKKATDKILELSKKITFSMVKHINTTKDLRLRLGQSIIEALEGLTRGNEGKIFFVKIEPFNFHMSRIEIKDENGKVVIEHEVDSLVNKENVDCLFIKFKMPHAAFPAYFLLENSFENKDEG